MNTLFENETPSNLLPFDGEVFYYGQVMPLETADAFMKILLETIDWQHDEAIIFGRHIQTKRKVAWYGDRPFSYSYSKIIKVVLLWTPHLLELKHLAESISGHPFNSCLMNLYHNGDEGVGWHSDDEKTLGNNPVIASLSLGAERKFVFKSKQHGDKVSVLLLHSSFLVMKGATQHHWVHSVPKMLKVKAPRISLTFRKMVEDS